MKHAHKCDVLDTAEKKENRPKKTVAQQKKMMWTGDENATTRRTSWIEKYEYTIHVD